MGLFSTSFSRSPEAVRSFQPDAGLPFPVASLSPLGSDPCYLPSHSGRGSARHRKVSCRPGALGLPSPGPHTHPKLGIESALWETNCSCDPKALK